jgi:hypothetical protein
MGTVHYNGPPETERPCVICLMRGKYAQLEAYKSEVDEALKADAGEEVWIPWPPGIKIYSGYYRAVPGDAPGLGIVDGLCWDHVAGFGTPLPAGPALDVTTQLPPGLLKGSR